ncbi:hypothetical protein [Rhodospirillaceae bacterium SYSU D60014]|uniref:hypothetical protein n=1 Tax=Virgifigura deserti TaxID=2268457 RepID=UPI000E6765F5
MKRGLSILFSGFLLTACAGDRDERTFERPVTASFVAEEADVVEVRVTDEQPVEAVELVGPDGRVYRAHQILRDRIVEERGGALSNLGIGVGVTGGSSSRIGTSIGLGFPLGGFGGAADEPEVLSRARIQIEDMAAYRADWQDWTVRIQLGTSETGLRFMEVPAPSPPPAE